MSSDLCFWNRDEEGDQQSPHWRKKETIKESRFFHLYFVDSKGCLFFNLVPPFTTFLKEERAQYVFILSFLMLLQREKSTKNKLLKKWQICSNNNKKKSGSKKLTSVTGVVWTFIREPIAGFRPLGSQYPYLTDVDHIRPTSWPALTPTSRWRPSGGIQ